MNYAFDGSENAVMRLIAISVSLNVFFAAFFVTVFLLAYFFGRAGVLIGKMTAFILSLAPVYVMFDYFHVYIHCKLIEWPDYCPQGQWEVVLNAFPTVVFFLISEFVLWRHIASERGKP